MNDRTSRRLGAITLALIVVSSFARPRVSRADERPALAPTAPMAPDAPPPASLARVHMAGDGRMRLERRGRDTDRWAPVCTAPCDEDLPLAGQYRVRYDSGSYSPAFSLERRSGEAITLDVEPPTKAGEVLLVAGGVVTALGVGAVLWASNQGVEDPCTGRAEPCDAGLGPGLAKAARVLLGGCVLVTGVSLLTAGAFVARAAEPHVKQARTFVREPTWVGPRPSLDRSAVVVPFGFSF